MSEFASRFLVANLAIGAAVLVVLALRAPVRAMFGARLAYAMWLLVPLAGLATLLPPRVEQIVNFVRAAPEMHGEWQGPVPWEPALQMPGQDGPAPELPTLAPPQFAGAASVTRESSGFEMPNPLVLALIVWLVGVVGMVAWQLRRQSRFVSDAKAGFAGPAVVGVIHPRIVTPSDFETTFDPSEREMILTHERIHIEGNDARINAFAALAGCICWFNPLVHLGAYFMRIDQELACDASVVSRHPEGKSLYASALLKAQLARAPLPLGCHWPSRSEHPLLQRVAMLGRAEPGRGRRIAGVALLGALAAASGVAAWAAMPPERRVIEAPRTGDVSATQDASAPQNALISPKLDRQPIKLEAAPPEGKDAPANLNAPAPSASDLQAVSVLRGRLEEADRKLADVARKYSDRHPEYQRALSEREEADKQLREKMKRIAEPPQTIPARFDANDPVYLRGVVEKIDFMEMNYIAYVRARSIAASPAGAAKKDDHLWQLTPINYWGDRAKVSKDILKEDVNITGYRTANKSCGSTCQMYVSTMIKCSVQATFAPGCVNEPGQPAPYQQQTPPAPAGQTPKPQLPTASFGNTVVPPEYDPGDQITVRGKVERIEFADTKYTVFVRASTVSAPNGYMLRSDASLFELRPVNFWGDRDSVNKDLKDKTISVTGLRGVDKTCQPACKLMTQGSIRMVLPTALPALASTPGFGAADVVLRYNSGMRSTMQGVVQRIEFGDRMFDAYVQAPAYAGMPGPVYQVRSEYRVPRTDIQKQLTGKTIYVAGWGSRTAGDAICGSPCGLYATDIRLADGEIVTPAGATLINPPEAEHPPGPGDCFKIDATSANTPLNCVLDDRGLPSVDPRSFEKDDRFDPNALVTIDGRITSANDQGWMVELIGFEPANTPGATPGAKWFIESKGFNLNRAGDVGSRITIRGYNARDTSCQPTCRMIGAGGMWVRGGQ